MQRRLQVLGRVIRQNLQLSEGNSAGVIAFHGEVSAAYPQTQHCRCFASQSILRLLSRGAPQPAQHRSLAHGVGSQQLLHAQPPRLGMQLAGQLRGMSSKKGPMPRFRGGKIKLRTAYKERFKAMADGTVRLFHPGFRHRRFRKSNTQRLRLKQPMSMHQTYANTLKRMGFK